MTPYSKVTTLVLNTTESYDIGQFGEWMTKYGGNFDGVNKKKKVEEKLSINHRKELKDGMSKHILRSSVLDMLKIEIQTHSQNLCNSHTFG